MLRHYLLPPGNGTIPAQPGYSGPRIETINFVELELAGGRLRVQGPRRFDWRSPDSVRYHPFNRFIIPADRASFPTDLRGIATLQTAPLMNGSLIE
ncbi:hypothetical protein SUGI_1222590 [Cryptomeria japonica]|uniref:Uncharacterized protein n=1 Tax=Cryptomeria japonica TaxID=3369 RepID=A0AAD3NRA8_CRYJA|nr:hypothetical protein SUGI_1222590 [Cryptomeria japonica]